MGGHCTNMLKVNPELLWRPQRYWRYLDPKRSVEESCRHHVQLAQEETVCTVGSRAGGADTQAY